jgi:hypothetical protein
LFPEKQTEKQPASGHSKDGKPNTHPLQSEEKRQIQQLSLKKQCDDSAEYSTFPTPPERP